MLGRRWRQALWSRLCIAPSARRTIRDRSLNFITSSTLPCPGMSRCDCIPYIYNICTALVRGFNWVNLLFVMGYACVGHPNVSNSASGQYDRCKLNTNIKLNSIVRRDATDYFNVEIKRICKNVTKICF